MKQFLNFLSRHKKTIGITTVLLVTGLFFRWEIREYSDAQTGTVITSTRGIVSPWQPCGGQTGGSQRINFHVTHWLAYGLVKIEATGQTY